MSTSVADLIKVRSSHGTVYLDDNGAVRSVVLDDSTDPDAQSLLQIRRFDLDEHVRTYGKVDREFDILDLGYWWMWRDFENIPVRKYEPPAYDWRELTAQFQKEAASG